MNRIAFLADATAQIGSGHVMRCSAIAAELEQMSIGSVFIVSTEESERFVCELGLDAVRLEADPLNRSHGDLDCVAQWCRDEQVGLYVDHYGLSYNDLGYLLGALRDVPTMYLDDLYTYRDGLQTIPRAVEADAVIDYSFFANPELYRQVYEGRESALCLGPRYAPLRPSFVREAREAEEAADCGKPESHTRILITSGSTNPGHFLERATRAALEGTSSSTALDVVVGPKADFDSARAGITPNNSERIHLWRGLSSLAHLMASADLAISSAGSTLYELAFCGVPAIACALVDNQRENCRAYSADGLGVMAFLDNLEVGIVRALELMDEEPSSRSQMSLLGMRMVDGNGARRCAHGVARVLGCEMDEPLSF